MSAVSGLQSKGLTIPVSRLRDLANRTMGVEDMIALWFGEPDVATPGFIIEPAHAAMLAGKTTYTEGLGKPWFRQALADYMSGLYAKKIGIDRIAVTVSGSNAVNLACQLLLEPGDRFLTTTPSFPTLVNVPALQHADIHTVPLTGSGNGWSLDLDHLLDEMTRSKVVLINSPNNPTGWVMSADEIKAVLDTARQHGTWIISDEVYARIVYEGKAAPSFADFAEPEDRVLIVNSFSKSWAMMGWRLGWLTLPPSLLHECEKLMEFSMSCAPEFIQAGGLAAIEQGEDFIQEQIARYRRGRDVSIERLGRIEGITCVPPEAAFYAFFQIDGIENDLDFAEALAKKARVGLAPGSTFDPSMTNWFRVCFAKDESLLNEAFDRFETFLGEYAR